MKFLIAIFRYFPYGGLQKDFLRIAGELLSRGHQVICVCMSWEGPVPAGLEVRLIPVHGWSNHGRADAFEKKVRKILQIENADCTLTMNRIGGFDFYFAADNCFALESAGKHGNVISRILPRYRVFLRQERSIFDPGSPTRIFTIVDRQKQDFQKIYQTEDERILSLPPGMNPACRIRPAEEQNLVRNRIRREFRVAEHEILLVQVASSPQTKGMDRTVEALSDCLSGFGELQSGKEKKEIPAVRLLLVGVKDGQNKCFRHIPSGFLQERVIFAGPRDDVQDLLMASDLMVHPARNEATGTVLIESIACACPVICSAACGFSSFVEESGGIVLPEPYCRQQLHEVLRDLLTVPEKLNGMKQRCRTYGETADFYRRAIVAADEMERYAAEKRG